MKIIDIHTHAFPDALAQKAIEALTQNSGEYYPVLSGTIDDLLKSMNSSGVDVSWIANIATNPGRQSVKIREWSHTIKSEKIFPLGSVHPFDPNWESELEAFASQGFWGIKLHPQYQGFCVDDEKVFHFYEKAAELGLFVMFHAGYDIAFPEDQSAHPERFARILKEFPSLVVIAAHMGGWRNWNESLELLSGRDIYLDTSFVHEADERIAKEILSRHSKERILFGSDSPWVDQRTAIESVAKLKVDSAYFEMIMGGNALSIMARQDLRR